jgi:hypothetical protein
MQEAEGINFSVGVPSENQGGIKKMKPRGGLRHNNPTLNDIFIFIERLSLTNADKDRLRSAARTVPHGALASFRKNHMRYIGKGGKP